MPINPENILKAINPIIIPFFIEQCLFNLFSVVTSSILELWKLWYYYKFFLFLSSFTNGINGFYLSSSKQEVQNQFLNLSWARSYHLTFTLTLLYKFHRLLIIMNYNSDDLSEMLAFFHVNPNFAPNFILVKFIGQTDHYQTIQ